MSFKTLRLFDQMQIAQFVHHRTVASSAVPGGDYRPSGERLWPLGNGLALQDYAMLLFENKLPVQHHAIFFENGMATSDGVQHQL